MNGVVPFTVYRSLFTLSSCYLSFSCYKLRRHPSRAPTRFPPPHNALHYDITLVPSDTGTHVLAEVQTTWRLGSTYPVRMQLDSAMRVIRVLVDGKPNTRLSRTMYARSSSEVDVPHEKQPGDTLSTRVRYHGFTRDGLIIGDNQYGDRTVFADDWPDRAHLWLASDDRPGDKATVSFHVQAPIDRQVIANGVLDKIDTLPYGHAVWHYHLDTPIPVYNMVVGVGRLARTALPNAGCAVKCVPLSVWSYPQDSAYAADRIPAGGNDAGLLQRPSGAVSVSLLWPMSSRAPGSAGWRTPPPYSTTRRLTRRTSDELSVAHETAHQWFGDGVTQGDWPHLWLSEGFADLPGRPLEGPRGWGQRLPRHHDGGRPLRFSPRRRLEHPILDSAQRDLMALLNTNSYQKGGWVLHQLRGLLGDSAFLPASAAITPPFGTAPLSPATLPG